MQGDEAAAVSAEYTSLDEYSMHDGPAAAGAGKAARGSSMHAEAGPEAARRCSLANSGSGANCCELSLTIIACCEPPSVNIGCCCRCLQCPGSELLASAWQPGWLKPEKEAM